MSTNTTNSSNKSGNEIIQLIAEKKKAVSAFGPYSKEVLDLQKQYVEILRERSPEAVEFALRDLRDIYDHMEGPNSRHSLETAVDLARAFFDANDLISAKECIERVYNAFSVTYGKGDTGTLEAMEWYITILFEMEEDEEALKLDEEFLGLVADTYGPASFESFRARRNHGDLLVAAERWEHALDTYYALENAEEAIGFADDQLEMSIFQCASQLKLYARQRTAMDKHLVNLRTLGAEDIDIANAYSGFLDGFYTSGQYESALECAKALIPLLQKMGAPARRSLASVLQTAALISCKTEDYQSALKYSEKSLSLAKKCYKYDYDSLAEYQNAYEVVQNTVKGKRK